MALPASEMMEETQVYLRARDVLAREKVAYMVGGGQAVACYGHRRATKDIDFLVVKEDADRAVAALERDKFFIRRSDPRWLYQALVGDVLVDLVFGSVTSRSVVPVSRDWLEHARVMPIFGVTFPIVAPEELIGLKVLAQHESRPDWWDAEMILAGRRSQIDWQRVTLITDADPVKMLSFLLFIEARHPGEKWYPAEAFARYWKQAGALLQFP